MFHPICEHRPICRRAVGRWNGPMWLHFAQSADGMSATGTSHLPAFCPICQRFVQSAYWTKFSQMGHPVCIRVWKVAERYVACNLRTCAVCRLHGAKYAVCRLHGTQSADCMVRSLQSAWSPCRLKTPQKLAILFRNFSEISGFPRESTS